MSKRENQVSVPLPPDLRRFVESIAAREDRSMASAIRRLVEEAARRQNSNEEQHA